MQKSLPLIALLLIVQAWMPASARAEQTTATLRSTGKSDNSAAEVALAPTDTKLTETRDNTSVDIDELPDLLSRRGDKTVRPIVLRVHHAGEPLEATLKIGDQPPMDLKLQPGAQRVETAIEALHRPQSVPLKLTAGGKTLVDRELRLEPVRRWEIHLIHQTHLDIGFTHRQEDVLKRQVGFLHQALDFIEETKDYPEDSRFKWHPEGMWAIDEFLRTATPERREQFLEAIRRGYIHLDAFYVHMMTGLGTEEELLRLIEPAKRFERQYGVEVSTAIGSDVPGYTWGLVSAMGQQGVRYLNTAPNNNHRLGYIYLHANKPFWWIGPSGKHRVLCWMAPTCYIYFWEERKSTDIGQAVLDYIDKYLKARDYPYDLAQIRHEVGGDNGHPDLTPAKQIKAWNEKYISPRIILSTNTRFFKAFEKRYGGELPELSGDLTPFWEDGAASTSADLAVNRRAKERLIQAERLWTVLCPQKRLHGLFDRGWHNAVMYDEHTWGAHCSISQPFDPFTVSQEKFKRTFALKTAEIAEKCIQQATDSIAIPKSKTLDIYNTASWDRGGLVLLDPEQSAGVTQVNDSPGTALPVQRLAGGELAVLVDSVAALGATRFTLASGETAPSGDVTAAGNVLENGAVRIEIDPAGGAIKSIGYKRLERELVDRSEGFGLNDYLYTLGRTTGEGYRRIEGRATITVEDPGPLVGTLRIESSAPGCERLVRRVRIHAGSPRVELINDVIKSQELKPEQVYFAFPLNVPGAQPRIDVPYAVVRPEKDQLAGANRNYFCVERWVDMSNAEYGVTWIARDAPMIKFHPFQIIGRGRGCLPAASFMFDTTPEGVPDYWLRHIEAGPFFYSWVMTNHWECNYKAYQEGPHRYCYALLPHGPFDQTASQRAARETTQPLVPVLADPAKPLPEPPLRISGDDVIVSSIRPSRDGQATMVRLVAAGGKPAEVGLQWSAPGTTFASGPDEIRGERISDIIELPAYGTVTLRHEQP